MNGIVPAFHVALAFAVHPDFRFVIGSNRELGGFGFAFDGKCFPEITDFIIRRRFAVVVMPNPFRDLGLRCDGNENVTNKLDIWALT